MALWNNYRKQFNNNWTPENVSVRRLKPSLLDLKLGINALCTQLKLNTGTQNHFADLTSTFLKCVCVVCSAESFQPVTESADTHPKLKSGSRIPRGELQLCAQINVPTETPESWSYCRCRGRASWWCPEPCSQAWCGQRFSGARGVRNHRCDHLCPDLHEQGRKMSAPTGQVTGSRLDKGLSGQTWWTHRLLQRSPSSPLFPLLWSFHTFSFLRLTSTASQIGETAEKKRVFKNRPAFVTSCFPFFFSTSLPTSFSPFLNFLLSVGLRNAWSRTWYSRSGPVPADPHPGW